MEDNKEMDGFCPNEVPIELSLDPEDPLFAHKLEFWMRGEVNLSKSNSKRVRICASNNENTRLLFSLLRAMNCNAEELRAINAPVANDMRSLFVPEHRNNSLSSYYRSCRDIRHPLSITNERASMHNLLQILSSTLALYPTTLSQDMSDLMDETTLTPFSNKRHAKIQVRGEKEVLQHFVSWAKTALDVIDVIEIELKEEQQRGVEVQLGRGVVADDSQRSCGYDYIVRRMEEDETNLHHTIVRYCADVLGSLRREEFKNIRRHRAVSASNGSKRGEGYL